MAVRTPAQIQRSRDRLKLKAEELKLRQQAADVGDRIRKIKQQLKAMGGRVR